MARVVHCPSCQAKGAVPDGVSRAKIRCPKCGVVFETSASASGENPAPPRNLAASARPPRPASAYADLAAPEPAPLASSGTRRSPMAQPAAAQGPAQSPMLYVLAGVSGLAVLLLVVLVVVLTRGGAPAQPPAAVADAAPSPEPAVVATPPPQASSNAIATISQPATSLADIPSTRTPTIDPQEVIRKLKDATVFILVKVGGRPIASGTGFVVDLRGNAVLIATNRHVAVPDLSEIPASVVPKGGTVSLEVVFRGNQGKNEEQMAPAQLVAADLSEDLTTDLAFLVVRGVNRPPLPIDPKIRVQPTEGLTYVCAGFPYAGLLGKITESHGNPSVVVTGGRISSLGRDDYGQLNLLQVDGSLQPGNSGGPVVDEKTGRLLGVAVARSTAADTIGFVVPAEEVRKALAGRVGAMDLTLQSNLNGVANLQIKAQVVDPNSLVQSVMVHAIAVAAARPFTPNSDGSWPPMPNSTPVELRRDPKTSTATGVVQISLTGQGAGARKVFLQTARRDNSGMIVYSKPREVELPEQPGRILPAGQIQKTLKAVARKSVEKLEPLVDPDKDCKLTKDQDTLTIKIEIPGKLHSLSPEILKRNKKTSLHNAPMTVAEVEGDFAAVVDVTGDISPGLTLPKDRQGNQFPFTFAGGGLILYQDKNNFFRFERTGGTDLQKLGRVDRLLIEAVKGGRQAMAPIYLRIPDATVQLILIRRKGRVRCMFSTNKGATIKAFREFELDLPPKLKVGLSAANISAKPFTAEFKNFAIIGDTSRIDADFGS